MEISFHTTADWRGMLQSHFNQEDRNPWHFRTWDSAKSPHPSHLACQKDLCKDGIWKESV